MIVKGAPVFISFVLSLLLLIPAASVAQQDEWPATVGGKTIVSVNGAPAVEGEIIIRYDDGTPDSRKDEILESLGATLLHRFTLIDADAVELAPGASVASALPAVESIPGVRYTEANGISRPAAVGANDGDPLLRLQFTDQLTRGPLALKAAGDIERSHPVVAVLDSGVDYTHPDLKDSMWINEAENNGAAGVDDDGNGWIDDIYGIDACNGDGDPMDDNGHGTFVAGIIAATADNGEGIRGIHPGARIMALKISDWQGWAWDHMTAACLEYAIAREVPIANYSYYGMVGQLELEMLDLYEGIFVVAGGNDGEDIEQLEGYKVNLDHPYIVAVAWNTFSGELADQSSYGRKHVELAAPNPPLSTTWNTGGDYGYNYGTSFSAPQFCGAAALVSSVHPGLGRLEIIDLILATVDQFAALRGKLVTGGQLDIARAVMGRSAGGRIVESDWHLLDDEGPTYRQLTAMAYDSGRNRLVVFGGQTSDTDTPELGDTWEWDGSKWLQIGTSGPSPRFGHAMAYDSRRGVTVLYGGRPFDETRGETWEWDGVEWRQVATAHSPGPVYYHSMVYDAARGQVVLFGGCKTLTKVTKQTWIYDGNDWVLHEGEGPSARYDHAMCYDSDREVVVFFSGCNRRYLVVDDLWEWNGLRWKQVATKCGLERGGHRLVYDPVHQRTILYGGFAYSPKAVDTWSWDGEQWLQIAASGPLFENGNCYLAWDEANGRVLAVGEIAAESWDLPKMQTWSFTDSGEAYWLDNLVVGSSDFDGDGSDDIACWDPTKGELSIRGGGTTKLGKRGDIPVPGDYDGDGRAEIATFRPFVGMWHFENRKVAHGEFGDIPVPGDYDGDGSDEIGVYRPSDGTWRIKGQKLIKFGSYTEIPVPADYDGDGITDLALFNPHTGLWRIRGGEEVAFGKFGDSPVPADYDGDGKADIAVYRVESSKWILRDGTRKKFGERYDIPVPGDYDGDGRAEFATFRPKTSRWYIDGQSPVAHGRVGHVPLVRGN